MDFKVRKGLDQPLRVQGMLLRYFYTWVIIGVVLVLILMSLLLQASRQNSNITIGHFLTILFGSIVIMLVLKFLFMRGSQVEKMKFKRQKAVISNIDIMKALK